MPRLASLAMYDTPSASAAFWSAIADRLRQRGIAAPDRLSELPAETVWRDPDLLFAQTCGYPLTSALAGLVRLVAVPVYAAEGCEGPTYRSAIVVHHDDPATDLADCAGYLPAVNYRASQSGQNALRAAVAPLARGGPFFAPGLETGGHAQSCVAVGQGRAQIAAIDCVTFALLARDHPEVTAPLRRIGWTAPAPALPFITAAGTDDAVLEALQSALKEAMDDPSLAPVRSAMLLQGVEILREDAFAVIPAMERAAQAAGQPPLLP